LGLCIAREDASMTANVAVVGRGTWRRWAVGSVVVLLGLVAYAVAPRAPDLAGFDPDAIARRETAMWRDYYEKRYVALFRELYEVSRTEYDFSPLDSARIAFAAATAAKTFQPSTSRAAAEAALPALVDYFRLLSKGASIKVGAPLVSGGKVSAKVVAQGRDEKIIIVKFRRRKHYRRTQGHRQAFTEVEITSISGA